MKRLLLITLICSFSVLNAKQLGFEINDGQFDKNNRFEFSSENFNARLIDNKLVFDNYQIIEDRKEGLVLELDFINGNFTEPIYPQKESFVKNYFISDKEITNVKVYSEVTYTNYKDGIDLKFYIDNGMLRYDFIVHPYADPELIQIAFNGAELSKNTSQDLIFDSKFGEINIGSLYTYQSGKEIKSSFDINKNMISFTLGEYDNSKELIIDPVFYSSYLGGEGEEKIIDLVKLDEQNYIVAGHTNSFEFQSTPGAYSENVIGGEEFFITQFEKNSHKSNIVFSTFIGGIGDDIATVFDRDKEGNLIIAGYTNSADFPTKSAITQAPKGGIDGVYCKLTAEGNNMIFSSFLGGSEDDYIHGGMVGPKNNIFLVGQTSSRDFELASGAYQDEKQALSDGFITEVSADGNRLIFSTYYGGGDDDRVNDVDVNQNGDVFFIGSTRSNNLELAPDGFGDRPYDESYGGGWDMMIGVLRGEGAILETATYFGGTQDDFGKKVIGQSDKSVYFIGETSEEQGTSSIEIKSSAYQVFNRGGVDLMIGKLSEKKRIGPFESQEIIMNTFLGSSDDEYVMDATLNSSNTQIIMTGYTNSANFPQEYVENIRYSGGQDIFFASMSTSGADLSESRLFGSSGDDYGLGIDANENDDYMIVGYTNSFDVVEYDYPHQSELDGSTDGLIIEHFRSELEITAPIGDEEICKSEELEIAFFEIGIDQNNSITAQLWDEENDILYFVADNLVKAFDWEIPDSIPAGESYKIVLTASNGEVSVSPETFEIFDIPQINEFTLENEGSICEGSSVTFSIDYTADYDVEIEWFFDGDVIFNENKPYLIIDGVDASSEGEYHAEIKGLCKFPSSTDKIDFELNTSNLITSPSEAEDIEINLTARLVLDIEAEGTNLSYKWYYKDAQIENEEDDRLVIEEVSMDDSGVYYCIISGDCGDDIQSPNFNVIVKDPSSISNNLLDFFSTNVIDNNLNLNFTSPYSGKSTLELIDLKGNIVYQNNFDVKLGENILSYSLGDINNGFYLLRIRSKHDVSTQKLIID